MRFFKHGESLAIVLPEKLRKASNVAENDEYEFIQVEPGAFVLVSRALLEDQAGKSILATLAKQAESSRPPAPTPRSIPAPVPAPSTAPLRSPPSPAPSTPPRASQPSTSAPPARAPPFPASASLASARERLDREGFLVLENEGDARAVSQALEKEIKGGDVVGVRGFDKKFYIVSTAFHQKLSAQLTDFLRAGERSCDDLATASRQSPLAVAAVLQVMKDRGDVIEKKKGAFKLV